MTWRAMTDTQIMNELGERLQKYRKQRNYTQKALADKCGLSVFTIQTVEKGGNPSLSSLLAILRILGLIENLGLLIPEVPISPISLRDQLQAQQKKRNN